MSGSLIILQRMKPHDRLRIERGKISMISNARLTDESRLYIMTIGVTRFRPEKAPFLNLIRLDPFVVQPSANINNG